MTATGAWIIEDSAPAPDAGTLIWSADQMGPVTSSPILRTGGVLWPSTTLVIPNDSYVVLAQNLGLTQYAYAQPAATGGVRSAIQTLTLTQSAIPRARYKATALQPISLTSQGSGPGGARRTAIQTFSFTQSTTPKVALRATAIQTRTLAQLAIPKSLTSSATQTFALTQLADNTRDVMGVATQTVSFTQTVAVRLSLRATATQSLSITQLARPVALSAVIEQSLTFTQSAAGRRGARALLSQTLLFSQPSVVTVLARHAASIETLPLTQILITHVDLLGASPHPLYLQQVARPKDLDISLLPIPVRPDIIIQREATTNGGVTAAPGDVVVSSQQYS